MVCMELVNNEMPEDFVWFGCGVVGFNSYHQVMKEVSGMAIDGNLIGI